MMGQGKITRDFKVTINQLADTPDAYHVSYSSRASQDGDTPSTGMEECLAFAQVSGDDVVVRWVNPPKGQQATQPDLEQDARSRVRLLHGWLARLSSLVHSVETWAKELGWATRVIDKRMEDSQIGKYAAPGLVMQEGMDRILLEPIGRSTPGTEGGVDLYLMPAYDDVASFYFYEERWNLHRVTPGSALSARETQGKPLSKEALQQVLEDLSQHAA